MAVTRVRATVKRHPVTVTGILSTIGYGLVLGTFFGVMPGGVYPELSLALVNRLSDAIALINTTATVSLVLGWRWIRRGEVRKHRAAMLVAFALILLFLVLYLLKVGGGGTKEFVGPTLPYYAYLTLLAVHITLSVVSVPVVIYQVVTGLTNSYDELSRRSAHARIGRIAATAWIVSLSLGVLAYLLLNHVYGWEFVETGLVLIAIPSGSRGASAVPFPADLGISNGNRIPDRSIAAGRGDRAVVRSIDPFGSGHRPEGRGVGIADAGCGG